MIRGCSPAARRSPPSGTTFGLKTGGRIESILMSLPVHATWLYDYQPAAGSPEAELLDAAKTPRSWV